MTDTHLAEQEGDRLRDEPGDSPDADGLPQVERELAVHETRVERVGGDAVLFQPFCEPVGRDDVAQLRVAVDEGATDQRHGQLLRVVQVLLGQVVQVGVRRTHEDDPTRGRPL